MTGIVKPPSAAPEYTLPIAMRGSTRPLRDAGWRELRKGAALQQPVGSEQPRDLHFYEKQLATGQLCVAVSLAQGMLELSHRLDIIDPGTGAPMLGRAVTFTEMWEAAQLFLPPREQWAFILPPLDRRENIKSITLVRVKLEPPLK